MGQGTTADVACSPPRVRQGRQSRAPMGAGGPRTPITLTRPSTPAHIRRILAKPMSASGVDWASSRLDALFQPNTLLAAVPAPVHPGSPARRGRQAGKRRQARPVAGPTPPTGAAPGAALISKSPSPRRRSQSKRRGGKGTCRISLHTGCLLRTKYLESLFHGFQVQETWSAI